MPRPAYDSNTSLWVDSTFTAFEPDGSVSPGYPIVDPHSNLSEVRARANPASISNPKSASGWRDPSGWYNIGYNVNPHPGSLEIVFKAGYSILADGGFVWDQSGNRPVPFPPDSVEGRAINKALSQLLNQKVNLAVAFAEAGETAELFIQVAHTIASGVNAFRKGVGPKGWNLLRSEWGGHKHSPRGKAITDSYLAYMYGVNPLMQDVEGAVDQLDKRNHDGDAFTVSVKGRSSLNESEDWIKYCSQNPTGNYCGMRVSQQLTHSCLVRLDYVLVSPFIATLNQVGVLNPALIVWEKLPFSFVVDWFANVGQCLMLANADAGYEFKGGSSSIISRLHEVGRFVTFGLPFGVAFYRYYGSDYQYNGHRFTRTRHFSSPLPWFGLKNPFPYGSTHIANAIALLAGAYH